MITSVSLYFEQPNELKALVYTSLLYYKNSLQTLWNKGSNYLVPQRIENFEKFLLIVFENTGIDTNEMTYISPLWTYKLLTLISFSMFTCELFAFLN